MEGEHGHRIHLENRQSGQITGVVDVQAFDENEIRLETELGMLTVRGKELHLSRLSLDQGEVDLEGTVEALVYSNGPVRGRHRPGSWKRLFQ